LTIDIFTGDICIQNLDSFMDWINLEGKQRVQKLKNVLIDN